MKSNGIVAGQVDAIGSHQHLRKGGYKVSNTPSAKTSIRPFVAPFLVLVALFGSLLAPASTASADMVVAEDTTVTEAQLVPSTHCTEPGARDLAVPEGQAATVEFWGVSAWVPERGFLITIGAWPSVRSEQGSADGVFCVTPLLEDVWTPVVEQVECGVQAQFPETPRAVEPIEPPMPQPAGSVSEGPITIYADGSQARTYTPVAPFGFAYPPEYRTDITVTVPAVVPCPSEVTPVAPTLVVSDTCDVEDLVVLPETTGVTYTPVRDGREVTVTATADRYFFFAADAVTEWTFTLAEVEECPAEPTDPPTVEPTDEPTQGPTAEPTDEPTSGPTAEPTGEPTAQASAEAATDSRVNGVAAVNGTQVPPTGASLAVTGSSVAGLAGLAGALAASGVISLMVRGRRAPRKN